MSLDRFPLPPLWAGAFRLEESVVLPGSPEELWPHVADTDRINRMVGLPAITYRFEALPSGSVRTWASARVLGMRLEWEEKPFVWMRPHGYDVERLFVSGPIARMCVGIRVAPEGRDSRVTAFGDFVARSALQRPIGRMIARRSLRKLMGLLRQTGERLGRRVGYPRAMEPVQARVDRRILEDVREKMDGADPALAETLFRDLETLPDHDVVSMRPFEWADGHGFARMAALELFLHATSHGVLDMCWALLCPHCGGSPAVVSHLADLPMTAQCDPCQARFAIELDRAVEARFGVAPRVRRAKAELFCRGGPMNRPFVRGQWRLAPGAGQEVSPELLADGARVKMSATLAEESEPGTGRRFLNQSRQEIVLWVEEAGWEDRAATAALVATLRTYQNLFASDVLAPGQEIAIRHLAVLFSDLQGSTALYQEIGDARAYAMVRDHFRLFEEILAAHGGALVKTIGDAVMAVFQRSADAVAAAAEAHARMPAPLVLKIGVHAGPLLAVLANGRNDFFGTTVNVAARLQALAGAGETVISEAVSRETGEPGGGEPVRLRGIAGDIGIRRLRLCT